MEKCGQTDSKFSMPSDVSTDSDGSAPPTDMQFSGIVPPVMDGNLLKWGCAVHSVGLASSPVGKAVPNDDVAEGSALTSSV